MSNLSNYVNGCEVDRNSTWRSQMTLSLNILLLTVQGYLSIWWRKIRLNWYQVIFNGRFRMKYDADGVGAVVTCTLLLCLWFTLIWLVSCQVYRILSVALLSLLPEIIRTSATFLWSVPDQKPLANICVRVYRPECATATVKHGLRIISHPDTFIYQLSNYKIFILLNEFKFFIIEKEFKVSVPEIMGCCTYIDKQLIKKHVLCNFCIGFFRLNIML